MCEIGKIVKRTRWLEILTPIILFQYRKHDDNTIYPKKRWDLSNKIEVNVYRIVLGFKLNITLSTYKNDLISILPVVVELLCHQMLIVFRRNEGGFTFWFASCLFYVRSLRTTNSSDSLLFPSTRLGLIINYV